jgi:hypothetical protein
MSWIDSLALSLQILTTGLPFKSSNRPVIRRSAFDHVSNVDPFSIQSGLLELEVEQLTSPSRENSASLCLVFTRRHPYEHYIGVGVTRPTHAHPLGGLVQYAPFTAVVHQVLKWAFHASPGTNR